MTPVLRHWVDDGLMTLFFLVVGLEIKRELVDGELRTWRRAALPVVAAAGGMAVPALIYAAGNAGGPGAAGWGVPMATDIAFALGVLALLGSRVPAALKVFLLTLAVVDDLGSIAVVALFYSRGVDLGALAVAAGLLAVVAVLVRAGVWWLPLHVGLGLALWLALWHSGVSPALAGVAMGLLTPARPTAPPEVARDVGGALAEELAAEYPKLLVAKMLKTLRGGKVLLDWSQNNPAKTTICPYSLRGRAAPWVAAPRTWQEIEAPRLRQLTAEEVLDRVADQGDLGAALLEKGGRIPS